MQTPEVLAQVAPVVSVNTTVRPIAVIESIQQPVQLGHLASDVMEAVPMVEFKPKQVFHILNGVVRRPLPPNAKSFSTRRSP